MFRRICMRVQTEYSKPPEYTGSPPEMPLLLVFRDICSRRTMFPKIVTVDRRGHTFVFVVSYGFQTSDVVFLKTFLSSFPSVSPKTNFKTYIFTSRLVPFFVFDVCISYFRPSVLASVRSCVGKMFR